MRLIAFLAALAALVPLACKPLQIATCSKLVTDKPFGVDLLAALPESMLASIDAIIEGGAKAFIAGLGVPGPVIQRCHDAGLLVMSMCGKVSHAIAAEEAGCDVVVAQGTEAGGHTGQVGGIALIPQIVDAVDIPVLAAGAIVDGRGLAAALAFGAQGIWMGTRFIASAVATCMSPRSRADSRTSSPRSSASRRTVRLHCTNVFSAQNSTVWVCSGVLTVLSLRP